MSCRPIKINGYLGTYHATLAAFLVAFALYCHLSHALTMTAEERLRGPHPIIDYIDGRLSVPRVETQVFLCNPNTGISSLHDASSTSSRFCSALMHVHVFLWVLCGFFSHSV